MTDSFDALHAPDDRSRGVLLEALGRVRQLVVVSSSS